MSQQNKTVSRIEKWVAGLSQEQIRPLLVEMVYYAYEAEYVCLGDLAPYYEATGEPLVEGQRTYNED